MWKGVLRKGSVQEARKESHSREEGPGQAEPGEGVRAVWEEVHSAPRVQTPRQQPPG